MKTAWKVALSIVAAVLLLFVVAEVGIRTFVAKQVTSQAPEGTSVSFGASPVTLGLLGGKFPHMTVDQQSDLLINGDEISGTPASVVDMDNVRLNGGEPVAESLRLTTELPNDFVRAMLNQQLQRQIGDSFLANVITVSDVTSNEDAGTFTIVFTSGAAGIELQPVMQDGQLTFQARSTELFGFELPDEVAQAISSAMSEGVAQEATGGMNVEDFTVIPGGLRVSVAGSDVNFSELQQMQQNDSLEQTQPSNELSYQS
ncbi:DUF2993 domain-containing protein [Corynebacterium wankanglinii]|uniref:DUF2993 domain-containing protein n=1 Tax=Corynebacterium wankanglinii TaxID=2735136 RepID=A0A838CGD3_9CORY|nr:DUF2993 domain-containing protein [Corynebacterium wankanglinii]MBA1834271.1 DUF2993 domain-containing protein [Corynebacterium wankanglinii]